MASVPVRDQQSFILRSLARDFASSCKVEAHDIVIGTAIPWTLHGP